MLKKKQATFYYIDKARIEAGFFISEACQKLGISKSTWYRWKATKMCPEWALAHMELLAGNLDLLGWKNWKLEQGVLYRRDLNPKYYNWKAEDLMISVFCDCPAHQRIRGQMRPTDNLKVRNSGVSLITDALNGRTAASLSSGYSNKKTGFVPVVLIAESQSYPAEKQQFS